LDQELVCLFWNDRIGVEEKKKTFFLLIFLSASFFDISFFFLYFIRTISAKILNLNAKSGRTFLNPLRLFFFQSFRFSFLYFFFSFKYFLWKLLAFLIRKFEWVDKLREWERDCTYIADIQSFDQKFTSQHMQLGSFHWFQFYCDKIKFATF